MDSSAGGLADYAYRVVTGSVGSASRVATLGVNPDIDIASGPEDAWAGSELGVLNGIDHKFVQLPQTAVSMALYCANANDTVAGTGVRTVSVTYLDASRVSKTVTLPTNGNTEVALPEPVLRINGLRGLTSGTFGGSNLGPISIRAAGGLGATYAYMQTDAGFARSSLFSVPAGVTLDVLGTISSINRPGAGQDRLATLLLVLQTSAGFRSAPLRYTVSNLVPYPHQAPGGVPIASPPAGTDVWLRCESVSSDNTDLTAGYFGYTRTGGVS